MNVPMSSPDINKADKKAVQEVLDTRWLSGGPKVKEFEERFADYIGVKHAVAVSNGTAGLHLAVKLLPGRQKDVVTTPFSFVASSNVMWMDGRIVTFFDVDEKTLNINITNNWLDSALVVDVFGQPWDRDSYDNEDTIIIEDACEALGAEYKGRKAGTLGDISVFAFYPNKQITTGEGGMICTNNDEWARLCRSWRNQGRGGNEGWFEHVRLGYNYRMDEMSAALGISQLSRIDELLEKRDRVAYWYTTRLQDYVEVPYIADYTTRMSWFVYVIRVDNREDLIENLTAVGIPTRTYFKPIHLMPMYGYERGSFPNAERAGDRCLALPFSGVMTEKQVDFVCKEVIRSV